MVYVGVNRCASDRIESKLSNALRFKSIYHFLENMFSIESMADAEKSVFSVHILDFLKNVMISIEDVFARKWSMDLNRSALESLDSILSNAHRFTPTYTTLEALIFVKMLSKS